MSKPKKLLKKMIIAVFTDRNDNSFTASIGIFLNSVVEEPIFILELGKSREENVEKTVAKKIVELATPDYRWNIYFSREIRTLLLEDYNIYLLNPDPYINMEYLQSSCFKQ
ncbi:MAG: hypothetical protein ACOYL8_03850 [Patescibacteria group bacterium]